MALSVKPIMLLTRTKPTKRVNRIFFFPVSSFLIGIRLKTSRAFIFFAASPALFIPMMHASRLLVEWQHLEKPRETRQYPEAPQNPCSAASLASLPCDGSAFPLQLLQLASLMGKPLPLLKQLIQPEKFSEPEDKEERNGRDNLNPVCSYELLYLPHPVELEPKVNCKNGYQKNVKILHMLPVRLKLLRKEQFADYHDKKQKEHWRYYPVNQLLNLVEPKAHALAPVTCLF